MPEIVEHINRYESHRDFNFRIYKMLEGELREEIEKSLRREIISTAAFRRAVERIPTINVLSRAVDKLSKAYIEPAKRKSGNAVDEDIMEALAKVGCYDQVMHQAQRYMNAQWMTAIEFFLDEGVQKIRALPGHTFLPFSDDPVNPLKMTVFIKFLGVERDNVGTIADDKGNINNFDQEPRETDIIALYSDDEFLVIDSTGSIREDKMAEFGAADGRNPFGVIPFCYINTSDSQLIPYLNQSGFDMSVLVPKLLTDLNYAAQFNSHSIVWIKNAELHGKEINPDSFIDLGDGSPEIGDPEIGTIKPETDIEGILQLVQFEMSMYLASIGIKTTNVGSLMPGREASGFAKAIDEGDATSEQKRQAEMFKKVEVEMWSKIAKIQDSVSSVDGVVEKRKFTRGFISTLMVKFAEMKPMKSDKDRIEEAIMAKDGGLSSLKRAMSVAFPDLTEDQIDAEIAQIEKEKTANIETFRLSPSEPNPAEQGMDDVENRD